VTYEAIIYEKKERIAYITFNRPDVLNAVNERMILELDDALTQIETDTELRVLILTGTGRAFVAGGDIGFINKGTDSPYEFFLIHDKMTRFNFRLERLRIPVIAAINGFALGGGLEIATACDIRIAAQSSKLGVPEVGLGIMPGAGATARLPNLIGKGRALQLELTGDPIDAQEAYRIGLVNLVVPDGEALQEAEKLANRILRNGPAAVALIKRAIHVGTDMPLEGAMEYCQYSTMMTIATKDSKEGTKAFLEKRRANWQGK
jgi:enoyl-CoA hydratase/carnithine racemase